MFLLLALIIVPICYIFSFQKEFNEENLKDAAVLLWVLLAVVVLIIIVGLLQGTL